MLFLVLLHACWSRTPRVHEARLPHGPAGLLASPAFWLGGIASAALWALALEIAFG